MSSPAPSVRARSDTAPSDWPSDTAPSDTGIAHARKSRVFRRCVIVALVLFVALAAGGALGVRTRSTTVEGGGYRLTVTYGAVSRPGLATPWSVEIVKDGGFGGEAVVISTSSSYFDAFDENGLDPDPAKSTTDGELTYFEFEPPPGDTLTVSFDARIEPGVQLERVRGETSVLADGEPVATARYTTWVLP